MIWHLPSILKTSIKASNNYSFPAIFIHVKKTIQISLKTPKQ